MGRIGGKKKRLVIHFRKLNEHTKADRYSMQNILMVLTNLEKAKYFTTLDLRSGYQQIIFTERDIPKTDFFVKEGKYEFFRLHFGLKNAGSIFQRAIDDVLLEQIIVLYQNGLRHVNQVDWVLKRLLGAKIREAQEKTSGLL